MALQTTLSRVGDSGGPQALVSLGGAQAWSYQATLRRLHRRVVLTKTNISVVTIRH